MPNVQGLLIPQAVQPYGGSYIRRTPASQLSLDSWEALTLLMLIY